LKKIKLLARLFIGLIFNITIFKEKVYCKGKKNTRKTLMYKRVAMYTCSAKAYRAVANIRNKNKDPKISGHQVISLDINPGGYNRDIMKKEKNKSSKIPHQSLC